MFGAWRELGEETCHLTLECRPMGFASPSRFPFHWVGQPAELGTRARSPATWVSWGRKSSFWRSRQFPAAITPGQKVEDKFLGFEFDQELSQQSVTVVRVPHHPLHYLFDGRPMKKALRNILEQRRVDIVLSFYHEAAFLPSFLRSRKVKFGYIAAWQSYAMALGTDRRRGGVRGRVREWENHRFIIDPHRRADILFANSDFTRRELTAVLGVDDDRIVVCPLGVDPKFMEISRPAPPEISRFIFFGRIVPSKGVADAIEALGQLAGKGFKNWSYRIVGQGDHEWARNLAREHGVAENVEVCGPVDDEGLRGELKQAHLAILPSHAESFGLSIAEAQAAGIPVVAYQAGSVPEVVEDGVTAWLAPFRRVDELARYIEKAVQNPEMTYRAGLAGRDRIGRMFTWDRTAATVLDGIQAVI